MKSSIWPQLVQPLIRKHALSYRKLAIAIVPILKDASSRDYKNPPLKNQMGKLLPKHALDTLYFCRKSP